MRRTSFISGSTPTVVLVHGAFADASGWGAVIAELQAQGMGVVAPALALRTLAADAATVVGAAERFDGPVILAGHGYGGAVVTVAGASAVNVVGLVYVAGFALAEGESCSDVAARFPRRCSRGRCGRRRMRTRMEGWRSSSRSGRTRSPRRSQATCPRR